MRLDLGQDLTARNDTGNINVGGTLTVSNSSNATSVDTATAFSSSNSYSHGYGDTTGLVFNDDGTKVYFTDSSDQRVYQRNLGTAFDVSTGTGSVSSLYLNNINPYSLSFNNDGTKLYVLDYNDVNEYALTTGFDVTTASLTTTENLSSQESTMRGLTFNNDGTKMFTVGDSNNRVYEYALSSAFDISSLSFTDYISISSQESSPQEIKFNHDGTKMYISGASGDDINEYTLSTAFDISSTVTHKGSFSVSSSDGSTGALGFSFNNDGTKLFTTGSSYDRINERSLTTPFSLVDVSGEHSGDVINTSSTDNYDTDADGDTLTVTNISHSNSNTDTVDSGSTYSDSGGEPGSIAGTYGTITIGADGSYKYVVADNSTLNALDAGDIVTDTFNYTVSDGQGETDIATITITITGINDAPVADNETGSVNISQTLTVTDGSSDLLDGDTDSDGSASLRISSIVATTASGSATAVNLGTAYNSGYTSVTGSYGTLRIGADGTYQYIANSSAGTDVFTYTLSDGTATDTATLTITVNTAPVAANNTGTILEDGTLTVSDGAGANSSGGVTDDGQTADISTEETSVSGLSFNNDGTKMFVSGGQSDKVHEYSLSTAFDVSTKSATANESYSDISSYDWTRGHTWNADGTKLFIIDNEEGTHQKILEHTVQTAFDLSSTVTRTNAYDLVAPSGGSIPTRPKGITFNSDGTKMYIADHATDKIHQFTLSVGYNLASTVANSGTLDVSSQNDSPYGVEFSQDGSKVFVVGNGTEGDAVYQYTLNTAWDITSTATYNGSFDLSSQDSVPEQSLGYLDQNYRCKLLY